MSLIWPNPDWAARLRSTPVLISEVTALASRVSSPMVEAIWLVAARVSWASFFTSAATTAKLRPASPARAASMVAFKASMLVLRAIVSIVEETVCTWFIARGEAGHPLAQLDDQVGQSLEALRWCPRSPRGPASSLALACSQSSRASSVESRHARLVGEQPGGHFLERVEHLQMLADPLGDPFDIAGDVAAFDRQRAAIARHGADCVFSDFFDAERRHYRTIPICEFEPAYRPITKAKLTTRLLVAGVDIGEFEIAPAAAADEQGHDRCPWRRPILRCPGPSGTR